MFVKWSCNVVQEGFSACHIDGSEGGREHVTGWGITTRLEIVSLFIIIYDWNNLQLMLKLHLWNFCMQLCYIQGFSIAHT